VAQTGNTRVIAAHELYCCLLYSTKLSAHATQAFPIATSDTSDAGNNILYLYNSYI